MRPPPAPNVTLGHILRRLREQTGLSQEALAEAAGLHRNHIGLIERAERNPGWNSLVRITAALGISMTDLARLYDEHSHHNDTEAEASPKTSAKAPT